VDWVVGVCVVWSEVLLVGVSAWVVFELLQPARSNEDMAPVVARKFRRPNCFSVMGLTWTNFHK
jgi:hypothetical protein